MKSFQKGDAENDQPSRLISLPVDQLSDEVLLSAVARGAVWAMEILYERYSRILYSLAYRMVADHQVAEDLLQDAFLAVWRRATSYSPQSGAVRSWIVSIMHHRTIDYLRSIRRRSTLKEASWEEVERDERTAFPDAWDEAWQNIQSAKIREALMQLPTEQRMVIELAYFQGWTHSEIAEGCQIPLGTVKARMRLGLARLKRVVEEMGLHEP
ncbi:MAG TPA: sigma-70 family RNA polymerase sigma factor [Ktedonobacteraceae bacterium]|nr:sigma-70 family RNA polymerase sigma factor [Ktedonobacteraceae bacterium]